LIKPGQDVNYNLNTDDISEDQIIDVYYALEEYEIFLNLCGDCVEYYYIAEWEEYFYVLWLKNQKERFFALEENNRKYFEEAISEAISDEDYESEKEKQETIVSWEEDKRNFEEMILSENVMKTIFLLTIPVFMMGIVQSLIPISDGLFLNNKAGYVIAGAIGFSQSVINILNAFSQGLSVAASAIIGQLYGKGDIEKTKQASVQILVLSFIIGLLLSPICLILSYIISRGVNEELSTHVFQYLGLYSFVLPFLFMAAIFNSIKNGTGHPEAPFLRMIILLVLKVIS